MDIKYEDFKDQLKNDTIIGHGASGIVYKIYKGDKEYAVKDIDLTKLEDEEVKNIENEANILTKIDHENIVKYYNSFKLNNSYYIIMEYCNYSDLDKFIQRNKKKDKKTLIDTNVIYSIVLDICLGIKEIHKKNIIHRDLKPLNIFINKDYKIKIGDFGIAKELNETIHAHTANIGTFDYMAPEIIDLELLKKNIYYKKGFKYDNKVDIWAFGCIIYELCTLEKCFNLIQIMNKSYNYTRMDNEFQKIVDKLLIIDPEKRPDIDKVYELISNLNIKDIPIDENYLKSLDDISQNILKKKAKILKSQNKIVIIIKVKQKDINKKIYFLDNESYFQNDKTKNFKDYNKEIKELKENQVELFINDNKKENFNKYFIPDKEGEYKIKIIFKNKMTDCRYMFRNCDNIKSVDLSSFDSSEVNNMNYMFGKCHYLEEVNFGNLVTDKVIDISYMFNKCYYLKKLHFPLSFNTKKVEKMNFMFHGCQKLSEIKFSSSFITNNVKTVKSMFKKCVNLKSIDLTNFTSENLLDMSYMFHECTKLEKILLNKEFKTNKVTNMAYLFSDCNNLKEIYLAGVLPNSSNINLSSFNTENVEYLDHMFSNCLELKNIDLSNFKVKEKINMTYMFQNCKNLEKIDISSFENINNNSEIKNMFDNLNKIQGVKINKNCSDYLKESFKNIKEKFYS